VEQWSSGAVKNSSPTQLVHDQFDAFWTLYPRKVGRLAAEKAFAKAAKSAGAEVVLAGITRLVNDPNLPELQLIPHASTWLNEGRWTDDPYPTQLRERPTRGPVYFGNAPGQMRIEQ